MASSNSGNKKYAKLFITASVGGGSAAIVGYAPELLKKTGNLVIPAEINGKRIVEIQDAALANLHFATVTIPASVAKLGADPFRNCSYLKSVEVAPENPNYASLDGVLFNKTLTELVYYPTLKRDADYRVPDGVKKIRPNAFRGLAYLTTVYLPESVEEANNTFIYCSKLAEINVAPSNPSYSSTDGVLFNKDGTVLLRFTLDKKCLIAYSVPPQVKRFGFDAFEDCRGIRRIFLSESFEDFGWLFHSAMGDLEEINVSDRNPRYSSVDGVLFNKDKTKLVLVPNVKGATEYVLPCGVREIAAEAFDLAKNLQEIETDPDNEFFESVDGVLFTKDGKELVRYPRGKKWEDYVTPEKVETIRDHAFTDCNYLNRVVLSEDVRSVGDYAFGACSHLLCAHILGKLAFLGPRAFCFCASLRQIAIPEGVKDVLTSTFEASGLERVRLPESLESIGDGAFRGCRDLKEIVLGRNVKMITLSTFTNCPATLYVHKGSVAQAILQKTGAIFPAATFPAVKTIEDAPSAKPAEYAPTDVRFFKTQTLNDNEVAVIGNNPRYLPRNGVVVVPPEIDGRRVVELQNFAFGGVDFSKVVLPSTVERIERFVFFVVHSLKEIEVSAKNQFFASKDGVLFNKDITEIISYPMYKPDTDYLLPATVKKAAQYAFSTPRNLWSVCLQSNVEEFIGQFPLISSLAAINVSGNNPCYASHNGVLFDKDKVILALYPKGRPQKKYVLPASAEFIADSALEGAFKLEEIDVPQENENFTSIDGVVFDKYETKLVRFPAGNTTANYVVPETVQSINPHAFYYARNLTTVILPNGLETIGGYAFVSCEKLRKVVVPEGVKTLEIQTFADCASLRSVELPSSLEEIGVGAFGRCASLTTIDLPEGVKTIQEKAFFLCGSLKTVFLPASVEFIADDAFEDASPRLRVIDGTYAHQWAIDHGMKYD